MWQVTITPLILLQEAKRDLQAQMYLTDQHFCKRVSSVSPVPGPLFQVQLVAITLKVLSSPNTLWSPTCCIVIQIQEPFLHHLSPAEIDAPLSFLLKLKLVSLLKQSSFCLKQQTTAVEEGESQLQQCSYCAYSQANTLQRPIHRYCISSKTRCSIYSFIIYSSVHHHASNTSITELTDLFSPHKHVRKASHQSITQTTITSLALILQRNQEWLQLENAYVDVTCLTAAGLFSTH